MCKSERVLVTGGAGFIGSHFVDKLVSEDYIVTVLDNLFVGNLENIASHLRSHRVFFIKGDIRDYSLMSKCLDGIDIVVHFAALTSPTISVNQPDLTFDVNALATQKLLKTCVEQGVRKFLFASTCAIYGDAQKLPVDETCAANPISPYADSKLLAESYCFDAEIKRNLESVVFRFFNVYGQRQGLNEYSGVVTRFINRARKKKPLIVYGDGLQSRDFVSVYDVVNGVYAGMESADAHGTSFNIGSGKPTSIIDLARTISELSNVELDICYKLPRAGDIKHIYGNIAKAAKILGYKPQVTLRDGLNELL